MTKKMTTFAEHIVAITKEEIAIEARLGRKYLRKIMIIERSK